MTDPVKKILAALAIYVLLMVWTLHRVEQGSIVLIKRFGRLQQRTYLPGYHLFVPFVHQPMTVGITVQTDSISNIPCGTSGGMTLKFKRIEVVNRLRKDFAYETVKNYSLNYERFWLHDKIHHEVNQFCSRYSLQEIFIEKFGELDDFLQVALEKDLRQWAPGLEIIAIRVTKPKIGKAISQAYRKVEKTKALLKVVEQRQQVSLEQQRTKHMQALQAASTRYEVRLIKLNKQLRAKQMDLQLAQLQAKIWLDRNRTTILNNYNSQRKLVKLQPRFLSKSLLGFFGKNAFTNNLRLVMGPSIPRIMSMQELGFK